MKKIRFLSLILTIPFFGNAQAESTFQVDTIYSNSLQENRLLRIYLPPNFDSSKTYKVIYTTDGQLLNDIYKTGLDSLILWKIIQPIILIGVFSNEKQVGDENLEYRNYEYVKSLNPPVGLESLFENHLDFF